jgi:tetratricopeptide (TPR) repeat protein
MIKYYLYPFLGILLSLANGAFANDFEWTPAIQQSYTEISAMKIAKGRMTLKALRANANGFIPYLQSYADMIEIGITEDKTKYEDFINREEERVNELEALEEASPYRNFLIAEIYLHTAFIKLKFGHEVKGANEVMKAYKLLTKNAKKFPSFIPQQKSLGILHIVIGSIPQKFQWIANLFGVRGSVKEGIQALNRVITYDKVFANEAQLFAFLLNTYVVTNHPDESKELLAFIDKNPTNQAIAFIGASLLIRLGKSEMALNVIKKRPISEDYLPVPFFYYFLGEIYLQKGKYAEAINAYKDFTQKHRGFNFLKEANYKLFLSYYLNNDLSTANKFLVVVPKVGSTIVEADKLALKMSEQFLTSHHYFSNPEKALKKVQLATEGGYYEMGLHLLENMEEANALTPKDKIEKIYRAARIYDLTEDTAKAQGYYLQVLNLSKTTESSPVLPFAPRSCLYLGNIFRAKKEPQKAIDYFHKSLTFKDYEGSNSVEIKAKAALSELEK